MEGSEQTPKSVGLTCSPDDAAKKSIVTCIPQEAELTCHSAPNETSLQTCSQIAEASSDISLAAPSQQPDTGAVLQNLISEAQEGDASEIHGDDLFPVDGSVHDGSRNFAPTFLTEPFHINYKRSELPGASDTPRKVRTC